MPTDNEREEKKIGGTTLACGEIEGIDFHSVAVDLKGKIPSGYPMEQVTIRIREKIKSRFQDFYPKYL